MSIQFKRKSWLSILLAGSIFVGYFGSAHAQTVTNITVEDFSNPPHTHVGRYIQQEYKTAARPVSDVTVDGQVTTFNTGLSWFQAMAVEQGRFGLIYRHNIGYDVNFTVEDPNNDGYVLEIENNIKGVLTLKSGTKGNSARSGLLLARLDDDDGEGLEVNVPLTIRGGGLSLSNSETFAFKTQTFSSRSSLRSPNTYYGTKNFTLRMSSFPSPALGNGFNNYFSGNGVSIIQYGLTPDLGFQYGNFANGENINDLGLRTFFKITSLADPISDRDEDGIPDDEDNCPDTPNTDQSDIDGDGVGDVCDNCPDKANPEQTDSDADGIGDVCEIFVAGLDFNIGKTLVCTKGNGKGKAVTPVSLYSTGQSDGLVYGYLKLLSDAGHSDESVFMSVEHQIREAALDGWLSRDDISTIIDATSLILDSLGGADPGLLDQLTQYIQNYSIPLFDATRIDMDSLSLNGWISPLAHDKLKIDDLNEDGLEDVKLHFYRSDLCLAIGASDTDPVTVELSGTLDQGDREFEGSEELTGLKIK